MSFADLYRVVCLCRYQHVAKATFEVQAKQQYLKQLEAEAAKLQAIPGAGAGPAAAAAQQQQPQQALPQQQQLGSQQQQLQQQQGQGQIAGVWPAQQQPLPLAAAGAAAAGGQGGGGMMRVLEGTAQEVYRALLFLVFTIEVYVMSLVPFAGARAGSGLGASCVLAVGCRQLGFGS